MTAGMEPSRADDAPAHLQSAKPVRRGAAATFALRSALVACLAGCAARAGWVPAVAVGGSVSRALVTQSGPMLGSAPGDRELWDVRADLSVAWLPTPTESHVAMLRLRPRKRPSGAPCASTALCAWEREMRARVSNGVVAEESAP